jgi:alanyl-tRNA synthetase
VKSTGEIRLCKVIADSAVAAGTRRMEALTGNGVLKYYRDQEASLQRIAERLKTPTAQLEERVDKMLENQKKLENEIEALRKKLAQGSSGAETVTATYKGQPVKIHVLVDADAKMLRDAGDALRQKEPQSYHVVLAGSAVLVTVDETQLKGAHAGDFLKGLAKELGGRGGGQARTAQGQLERAEAAQVAAWATAQN